MVKLVKVAQEVLVVQVVLEVMPVLVAGGIQVLKDLKVQVVKAATVELLVLLVTMVLPFLLRIRLILLAQT